MEVSSMSEKSEGTDAVRTKEEGTRVKDSLQESGLNQDIFSETTVDIDDVSLHCVTGGEGSPLVLLHGWPETWYAWNEAMPKLAEEHTLIAPDYRGAGESSVPEGGYDKRTMANDIKQLVDELGYDRVGFAGHDIGGMIAYAFANLYPDTLDRFAIIDVPLVGIEPYWGQINQSLWHFGFHQVPGLAETLVRNELLAYLSYFFDTFTDQDVYDSTDRSIYVDAFKQPDYLTAGFEIYRAFPSDAKQNKLWAETKLETPALGVYGAAGPMGFFTKMMHDIAEDVRMTGIKGSGHFVCKEQPEALAEALLDFF